jgi:hypothetical protein
MSEDRKQCAGCKETKPLDDFYKARTGRLGRQGRCKECVRSEYRARYQANPEAERARSRQKHAANRDQERERLRDYYDRNKGQASARNRDWRRQHPDRHLAEDPAKQAARRAVINAVRRGRLVKPTSCEDCGNAAPKRALHGHHEDYSKPLEVEWLCTTCHGKRHRVEVAE